MSIKERKPGASRGSGYDRFADVLRTIDEVAGIIINNKDTDRNTWDAHYPVGSGVPETGVKRDILFFTDYLVSKLKNAGLTPRHTALFTGGTPYVNFYVPIPVLSTWADEIITMSVTPNAAKAYYNRNKHVNVNEVTIGIGLSDDTDMTYTQHYSTNDKYAYLDMPPKAPIKLSGVFTLLDTLGIDDVIRLYGYALIKFSNESDESGPEYLFLNHDPAYKCQDKPTTYFVNQQVINMKTRKIEPAFAVVRTKCSEWAKTYIDTLASHAFPTITQKYLTAILKLHV